MMPGGNSIRLDDHCTPVTFPPHWSLRYPLRTHAAVLTKCRDGQHPPTSKATDDAFGIPGLFLYLRRQRCEALWHDPLRGRAQPD